MGIEEYMNFTKFYEHKMEFLIYNCVKCKRKISNEERFMTVRTNDKNKLIYCIECHEEKVYEESINKSSKATLLLEEWG